MLFLTSIAKYKDLVSNFGYLNLVQFINYAIPLFVVPFIISTIGIDKFGLINYSIAIGTYFYLCMDFGFSLHGVKLVKQNVANPKGLSSVVYSIYITKGIIILICILVGYLLTELIQSLKNEQNLIVFTIISFAAQSLFPSWYFQGIEKMSFILYYTTISKLIYLALLMFYLESNNYTLVPIAYAVGWIVVALIGIISIVKKHQLYYLSVNLKEFKSYIIESSTLFISQFSINFFRNINTILLGSFSSNYSLGVYTTAEKIIKILQSIQNPLGQTLYPYLIGKWSNYKPKESIKMLLSKILIPIIFFLIICFVGFLSSEKLIIYFTGEINKEILTNFYLMLPIVVFGGLNYYLGILGLSSVGLNKEFMKSVLYTSLICLFVSIFLILNYSDYGASASFLISEILLLMFISQKIKRIINE